MRSSCCLSATEKEQGLAVVSGCSSTDEFVAVGLAVEFAQATTEREPRFEQAARCFASEAQKLAGLGSSWSQRQQEAVEVQVVLGAATAAVATIAIRTQGPSN